MDKALADSNFARRASVGAKVVFIDLVRTDRTKTGHGLNSVGRILPAQQAALPDDKAAIELVSAEIVDLFTDDGTRIAK